MRKQLLAILFAAVLGTSAVAQDSVDFKTQYQQLYKSYTKNPSDVAVLSDLAAYYAQPANPQYSLPQAATYIRRAEELYTKWLDDDAKYDAVLKLIRQKITLQSIRQQRKEIRTAAINYVGQHAATMDESELAAFADAFDEVEEITVPVRRSMLRSSYDRVCRENTIAAYYAFAQSHKGYTEADSAEAALSRMAPHYFSAYTTEGAVDAAAEPYPGSPAIQRAAMLQKSRIAYAEARRENTVGAYAAYMERYPQGSDYMDALARTEELVGAEFATLRSPQDYADFVENHGDQALADTAMARLRAMITQDQSTAAAQIYFSRFPLDPEYTQLYRLYYSWHAAEGNSKPIEIFAQNNPAYPYRMALEADLERGKGVDTFDLTRRFAEKDIDLMSSYIYKLTGRRIAFVALQRALQHQLAVQDFAGARARMQKYEICFENEGREEYAELAALLAAPVATPRSEEFATDGLSGAVMHPQGTMLYYNQRAGGIMYATRSGRKGRWQTVGYVSLEGGQKDMTLCGFYDEGRRALLASGGDIWTAQMVSGTEWKVLERLPQPVNTEYDESGACMLEDGSGLLLASDRPGGHNYQPSGSYFHGDSALASDIYFIPYTALGWGEAVNLGPAVNSDCCERSPLLSRNMRTLYFVTDAHGGLGYGDVYKCERADIDDWTHWSRPVNVGRLANSPWDESQIAFAANESRLMVTTADAQGQSVCCSFATTHDTSSCYRTVVADLSGYDGAVRRLDVAEVGSQRVVQTLAGTDLKDRMPLRLNKGRDYALLVSSDGRFVPAAMADRKSGATVAPAGYTLEQLAQQKEPIPLQLVRFADGSDRLLPLAEQELAQLAQFMKRNSRCMIELLVQVRGTDDEACYNLSLNRSLAVRSRLVELGVNPDRIRLSAYGNVNYKQGRTPAEVGVIFFEK